MVMILPCRRSFIPGRKLLILKNVAVRFPSTDARHPSSLVSSSGPGGSKASTRVRNKDVYRSKLTLDLKASGLDIAKAGDIAADLHRTAASKLNFSSDGR
jgi:hypothetical protein